MSDEECCREEHDGEWPTIWEEEIGGTEMMCNFIDRTQEGGASGDPEYGVYFEGAGETLTKEDADKEVEVAAKYLCRQKRVAAIVVDTSKEYSDAHALKGHRPCDGRCSQVSWETDCEGFSAVRSLNMATRTMALICGHRCHRWKGCVFVSRTR